MLWERFCSADAFDGAIYNERRKWLFSIDFFLILIQINGPPVFSGTTEADLFFSKFLDRFTMSESNNQDNANAKKPRSSGAEPIRSLKDIRKIIRNLKGQPRNRLLFIMGVNSPLRIGTLLKLKVGNVRNMKEGDRFYFDRSDSPKSQFLEANRMIFKALQEYFKGASGVFQRRRA
jgi:hypothetical protein